MLSAPSFTTHRDAVRTAIVVVVAAAALVSTLSTLSIFWTPRAGLGIAVSGTTITGVAPGSMAAKAGIRPGDRLDPAYGFAERARILWYDDFAPGEVVSLRTMRDGRPSIARIVAVQHPQPLGPVTSTLMALRLLTYVVFILVGASLVLLKPARFSWGFFLCCLGLATMPGLIGRAASIVDAPLGVAMYGIWLFIASLSNVGFLAFALRFPTDEAHGWRALAWRTLPLWFALFAGVAAWGIVAWFTGSDLPGWLRVLSWTTALAAWTVATLSLVMTLGAEDRRNRKRLVWAIVGASAGYLSWYADGLLQTAGFGVAGQIVGFGTLALPVSIAYAVLKHRVVDVRFALNRALIVSVVGTSVLVALALTYWATTALLQQSHLAYYIQISIAILVGVSLQRLYISIRDASTRLLIGDLRRARQAIARAAGAMPSVESYEALEALLASEAADVLDLEFGAVFRRIHDGSFERTRCSGILTGVPRRLGAGDTLVSLAAADSGPLRSRPVRECGAALALPVHDGAGLRAIVLFGAHRNGFDIDADEVRAIAVLLRPAGEAYRHLDRLEQQVLVLASAVRDRNPAFVVQYLADQILASLPPDERSVLLACASLPHPTQREIALVAGLPCSGERVAELVRNSPFIEQENAERFSIQTDLRDALRVRVAGSGKQALLMCAVDAVTRDDITRAAELYAAADCRAEALQALERYHGAEVARPMQAPISAHMQLVETTPVDALVAYPALLTLHLQQRCSIVDDAELCYRANEALQTLDAGDVRIALAGWLAYALSESGDSARASSALAYGLTAGSDGSGAGPDVMGRIAQGIMLSKRGLLDDGARILDGERPLGALMRAIHVEQARGATSEARALFRIALDRVPKPWSSICVAALADQLIGEWLAGADARCGELAAELEETGCAAGLTAFRHLAHNACGGSEEPPESAHPRHAAYSLLMRAANAADLDGAVRLAHRALERATASGEPLIAARVLVCLGELEPSTKLDRLALAVGQIAHIDVPMLHAALGAVVGGDAECGALAPLLARVRVARAGQKEPLSVGVATGTVRRGRVALALADSELALLIALSRTPAPQSALTLVDALWPDHDEQSAVRSLQSCVYRLRTRLGEPSAVESSAQGYRLREDVAVDLWDAEEYLAGLPAGQAYDPFPILRLDALRRTFGGARPAPFASWEWFATTERRIVDIARSARLRLADHWLRAGDHGKALECARELIAADDLDEAGWELSIRAHLASGSISESQRDFRVYRELLARELAVEPPPSLAALVSFS